MPIIIDDSTSTDVTHALARGLVERNYNTHPVGYSASIPPLNIPLIPESEWSDRIKERKRLKSRLVDIRRTAGPGGGRIPSLNQNSRTNYRPPRWGYCWAHSGTMANMLVRATMMLPYKKLSAFMVAAIIKGYRDEGGWGAQGVEFIENNGQPPVDGENGWAEDVVDRSLDTPAMRLVAAKYKISMSWADMAHAQYDRNLTRLQMATLLLSGVPVVADFRWWGHSVCLMDWDEIEPGDFGPIGLNSWGDQWGEFGEFTLRGQKAIPMGGVSPLVGMAA